LAIRAMVVAADPDRRVLQVIGSAREERVLRQGASVLALDAAV
jgi:hypothetical protein